MPQVIKKCLLFFISFTLFFNFHSSGKKIDAKEIKVAFLTGYTLYDGFGEFESILNNYSWYGKHSKYIFKTSFLEWDDVINGSLSKYKVMIVPYGIAFPLIVYHLLPSMHTDAWLNEIREFIKNGGGFVGHCGGTWFMCFLNENSTSIDTFFERVINSKLATLGLSNTSLHQDASVPLFDQIVGNKSTGEAAYGFYFGMGSNPGGFCILMKVNKSHPIFKGYPNETILVRYIGGPGLLPKKNSNVSVLLTYPSKDVFDKYTIHEWIFTGWKNLSINIMKQIPIWISSLCNKSKNLWEIFYEFMKVSWQTPDWKKSSITAKIHIANMPAMTAEQYGKGRIVLCGAHPELPVWNLSKGTLNETDTADDNIWDGIVKWDGLQEEDFSLTNAWLVRREVAWASGVVPDDELPPIE